MDANSQAVCPAAAPAAGNQFEIPRTIAVGAAAQMLATAGMVHNNIVPCVPAVDTGVDVVTVHGGCFNRVQVRGERSCRNRGEKFSFSLLRRKSRKKDSRGRYHVVRNRFQSGEIDVFVFVHVVYMRFFIVPASELDLTKNQVVLYPGSQWENAWHHLQG